MKSFRYAAWNAPRNATPGYVPAWNGSPARYAPTGYGATWYASWNAPGNAARNGWYPTTEYAFPTWYGTA